MSIDDSQITVIILEKLLHELFDSDSEETILPSEGSGMAFLLPHPRTQLMTSESVYQAIL